MKVEFITEDVQIGELWKSHETSSYTREDGVQQSLADIAVMTYEGMKFADTLFKTWGKTVKVTFSNGEHLEGLPEHKVMSESFAWVQLGDLRLGDRCLDAHCLPVIVNDITEGTEQDVYDIQVPDGHHYLANGMISHNSTLAAQLGINWADMGEDVTIIPLEMSEEEMTARLMANASNLDVRKILFKKLSKEEKEIYWKSYKRFVKRKKKTEGSFRIFKPKSDMTIEEIMASVYPLGSRVVIIDYISLLKGVDGDDAWQKLGAVARYCKIYAEMHNIIVVLLAQVSDEGVIRYARSIAEHANYAWKFVATSATREHEIINIEQLKARNGRMFDFTLRAQMGVMRIRDLELEEKEELETKTKRKSDDTDAKGRKGRPDTSKHRKGTDERSKTKKSKDASPKEDYLKDLSDDDDDD